MQRRIYKIVVPAMLCMFCFSAQAQTSKIHPAKTDTAGKADCDWLKQDSIHRKIAFKRKDSLFRYEKIRLDTMHVKLFKSNKMMDSLHAFKKMDSMHVKLFKSNKMMDSLHAFKKMDSMHVKLFRSNKMMDSVHAFKKMDSMHVKLFRSNKMMDSLHAFKRMDTLHSMFKLKQMNIFLKKVKSDLNKPRRDSMGEGRTREITMQLSCDKDALITINDLSRKINIKTSPDNAVRITAMIYEDAGRQTADALLFDKMGVMLNGSHEKITIEKSNTVKTKPAANSFFYIPASGTDKDGAVAVKGPLTISIPLNAKLVMESSSDINIKNDLASLKVLISHAALIMGSADEAVITAKDGSVRAAFINNADIDLANCRFVCGNITKLKINSKYSTVQFINSASMSLKSESDQYRIEEVGELSGNKTFGNISVSNLKKSFVLTGSSADIKIKNIDTKAELVRIDNKYAEIKLLASNLKNYSVDYTGNGSRFNDFFSKVELPDGPQPKYGMPVLPAFKTAVGNVAGDHTKFQINCSECIVGFN
ncbi:MAG: hypothetical protein ABJA78_01920 [Ferruginibacter sp.]